jgi:hypothetical protein
MPYAVEYFREGRRIIASCDVRGVELPVRLRGGVIRMYRWGSFGEEYVADETPGLLQRWPEGAHVSLDTIKSGDWWQLKPQPVKIAVAGFRISHSKLGTPISDWIKLKPGEFLQGALTQRLGDFRLYLVTTDPPEHHAGVTDPWPRIVSAANSRRRQSDEKGKFDESEREARRRARQVRG